MRLPVSGKAPSSRCVLVKSDYQRARRVRREALVTMTAVAALMLAPRPTLAGPTGGSVVAGSAGIQQSGNTTNINQSSNSAVINWQGFSIGKQETVNFNQPSASSTTLNRVIGNETSVINGALNANGQVFIVNSAGVLFGKGAQVNVGGIVASTLDISNSDFMAGRYTFSGSSAASVINRGHIHANPGGYVSLLGKTVANDGVISANLGTVAMASGQQITLNFGGNSLVDVTISKGALNALVSNKRAIIANGGQVIMTAKAADEVLSAQVNNTGIIQARTMAALTGGGSGTRVVHKGSIKLLAQGGTVNVSGKLDASAPKGGDGGSIETSGNKVHVADTAVITTKSANGQDGNWLIDPDGFTIAATGGDITGAALATALASNDVTILSTTGSGTDGNININDAVAWSSGKNLTLTATNSININAAITWSTSTGTLTLNANRAGINIAAPLSGHALLWHAVGDVDVNAVNALNVATIGGSIANLSFNQSQKWNNTPPIYRR
jgi:filamentous hemagglutinin family protein